MAGPLFASTRERRLWVWTLAAVTAIYSTLGSAGTFAGVLRSHGLLEETVISLRLLEQNRQHGFTGRTSDPSEVSAEMAQHIGSARDRDASYALATSPEQDDLDEVVHLALGICAARDGQAHQLMLGDSSPVSAAPNISKSWRSIGTSLSKLLLPGGALAAQLRRLHFVHRTISSSQSCSRKSSTGITLTSSQSATRSPR